MTMNRNINGTDEHGQDELNSCIHTYTHIHTYTTTYLYLQAWQILTSIHNLLETNHSQEQKQVVQFGEKIKLQNFQNTRKMKWLCKKLIDLGEGSIYRGGTMGNLQYKYINYTLINNYTKGKTFHSTRIQITEQTFIENNLHYSTHKKVI